MMDATQMMRGKANRGMHSFLLHRHPFATRLGLELHFPGFCCRFSAGDNVAEMVSVKKTM